MPIDYLQLETALRYGVSWAPRVIERGFAQVMAVDSWRSWTVASWLRVAHSGSWTSELYYFRRTADGDLSELSSGGVSGPDWPEEGWSPSVGLCELELYSPAPFTYAREADDELHDTELVVRQGYAGRGVRAIAFEGREARTIRTSRDIGAFVVCSPDSDWTLTPLGPNGEPVGRPTTVEAIER